MLVIFTLTIASGVKFFGETSQNNGKISNNEKASKQGESKHRSVARNSVSREQFGTSNHELHSYEEAYGDDENKYAGEQIRKERGQDYQGTEWQTAGKRKERGKRKKTGKDYTDWKNKCSLKGKGKKTQVEIPGCGGWIIVFSWIVFLQVVGSTWHAQGDV